MFGPGASITLRASPTCGRILDSHLDPPRPRLRLCLLDLRLHDSRGLLPLLLPSPPHPYPYPAPAFSAASVAIFFFTHHRHGFPSPLPIATVATANRHRRHRQSPPTSARRSLPLRSVPCPSPSLPTYPPDRHHSASPSTLYLIHLHLPRLLLTSSILASSVTSTLNLNPSDPLSLARSLLPPTAPPRHSHRE